MVNRIRKVAKEMLGESKGKIHDNKEPWWWSVRFRKLFGRRDDVTKFGKVLEIWKTMRCTRRQRRS